MIAGSHSDHYEWSAKLDKFDREENEHQELSWDKVFHLQLSNDGSTIIPAATPARELSGKGGQYLVINSPERELDGDLLDYTAELTLEYKRKEEANVPQIKEVITKTTIKSGMIEIGTLWPLGSTELEAEGIIVSVNPRILLTNELNNGSPALFWDAVATCSEQTGYIDNVDRTFIKDLDRKSQMTISAWVTATTSVPHGESNQILAWGFSPYTEAPQHPDSPQWLILGMLYHYLLGDAQHKTVQISGYFILKHDDTGTHPVRCFRSF
jgi:hypothetical protein